MGTTFDYAEVVGMDPPRSSAAVRGAHVIHAEHVRHFPPEAVGRHYLDELNPDDILVRQFHLNEKLLRGKVNAQPAARGVTMGDLMVHLA